MSVSVATVAAVAATGAFGVSSGGRLTTIAGGGSIAPSAADGVRAKSAKLINPEALAVDGQGNVYFADSYRVWKVSRNGTLKLIAGVGDSYSGSRKDGIPATSASLERAEGVALDRQGNVYITDYQSGRVRKVSPGGTISTVAGGGKKPNCLGSQGDGGAATAAQLCLPSGVAVDSRGAIYIAENRRVRKVSSGGTITTIAGTDKLGFSGDGGSATRAQLNGPTGVAVDAKGNVYIADNGNGRVRKVSRNGTITTIAGGGSARGNPIDGSPATKWQSIGALDVAADGQGNVYMVGGYGVYKVTPRGTIRRSLAALRFSWTAAATQ